MEELKLGCVVAAYDSVWLAHDVRGSQKVVRVDSDASENYLSPTSAAEAAGWLLGWLAEHAPEERIKLDTCHSATIAEALRVERDQLKAERDAATTELERESSHHLDVVAERDRLKADRDSLEVERGKLLDERNAALAELAAIRAAVVTDNSGDDDGWPTSLDAVRAVLASWSTALGDSQRESSELATQRDAAVSDLAKRDLAFGQRLSAFAAEFGLPPLARAVPADVSDLHKRVMSEINKRSEGLEKDLAAIADAVGLGGTRTRWEGQLLGKVENLIADVSDLRAANRTLTDANRELRAVLAEVPAQREAAAVATFEAVRAAFVGCEVVIRVPEVTRG